MTTKRLFRCYHCGVIADECEHLKKESEPSTQTSVKKMLGDSAQVDAAGGCFIGYAEEDIGLGDTVVIDPTGYIRRWKLRP